MSDSWITTRAKLKETLEKIAPADRLGYVDATLQCIVAIGQTNQGWLQWLSNPSMMNEFDENTLKEFFERLRQFAVQYIEYDIDATKRGIRPRTPLSERPYG